MPDERHEQNNDGDQRDMIRQLRARLGECEEERARLAAAAMSENSNLRAEVAMLSARLSDVVAMLAAQQQAAEQAAEATRAEGWRAGYDQRAEEEESGPPPRAPGERHLRIVSFAPVAAVAGRVLRHKVALSTLAAGALIVAAVPAWHTAEFRVAVPGHGAGPAAVAQAFAPQARPSSPPPGHDKSPHPSPGSSHGHGHSQSPGPQGTPPGQASPSPSPDATTDPGTPTATATPDPDPSGTPTAACTHG